MRRRMRTSSRSVRPARLGDRACGTQRLAAGRLIGSISACAQVEPRSSRARRAAGTRQAGSSFGRVRSKMKAVTPRPCHLGEREQRRARRARCPCASSHSPRNFSGSSTTHRHHEHDQRRRRRQPLDPARDGGLDGAQRDARDDPADQRRQSAVHSQASSRKTRASRINSGRSSRRMFTAYGATPPKMGAIARALWGVANRRMG